MSAVRGKTRNGAGGSKVVSIMSVCIECGAEISDDGARAVSVVRRGSAHLTVIGNRKNMFIFPDTEKKLKSRISSYRSALNKEKRDCGFISDGSGKRYLLFWLLFVLDDQSKSREYFEWYKTEFPDDIGEPIQKLCWALSLHRMDINDEAKYMLADLMLSNLYLIPVILGQDVQKYDIWHSSNYEEIDYVSYIPEEVEENIRGTDIKWMGTLYDSLEFRRIRERHIEIYHDLQHTKELGKRKVLLDESYSLLDVLRKK